MQRMNINRGKKKSNLFYTPIGCSSIDGGSHVPEASNGYTGPRLPVLGLVFFYYRRSVSLGTHSFGSAWEWASASLHQASILHKALLIHILPTLLCIQRRCPHPYPAPSTPTLPAPSLGIGARMVKYLYYWSSCGPREVHKFTGAVLAGEDSAQA